MTEQRVYEVSQDDVAWCAARDHTEAVVLNLGVLKASVFGALRHVDGWRIKKVAPLIEKDGRYVDPRSILPMRLWFVQVNIPDYDCEDAQTMLMSADDARQIAQLLLQTADEIDRDKSKAQRILERERRRKLQTVTAAETRKAMSCAIEGCKHERHFFDDGVGYCKRHAEERGLRPHGKVV